MRIVLLGLLLAACSSSSTGTPTEAVCPTPDPGTPTWEDFGMKFMADYCTDCHSSTLSHSQRNGAPLYHDFDTIDDVLNFPDHIDEQAGAGPAATNTEMPPKRCPSTPGGSLDRDCPQPTQAEREKLSVWLACEIARAK